jgi:Uma2 family endonuclease
MSAVHKSDERISEKEYFQLEKCSDARYELIDGYIYAMVVGSFNHGRITGNISRKIGNHLEGKPCEVFSESTKVGIQYTGQRSDYVYPDVVVDCSVDKANGNVLTTPVLIVEVLSASTHKRDETTKFQAYITIPTLQEYILITQDIAKIEIQRRRTNWAIEKFFLGDSIAFESIGLTLTVEEIYDRVQNEEVIEWLEQKAHEAEEITQNV